LEYINSDTEKEIIQEDKTGLKKHMWARLLQYRQTWAFVVGKFMTDGVWWFFLFWLPKYLEAQYGMVKTEVMLPLAVLYSLTMVGSVGGGWFPTYYINKGLSPYDGPHEGDAADRPVPACCIGRSAAGGEPAIGSLFC
jgi:ACS family hexuronate transporter-like MFS transporter